MKKSVYLVFGMMAGILVLGSFVDGLGKRDGTEPGHTGSPGDSLKNCTVCHGGVAVEIDGWVTSDVPRSGYIPGQRYTITATNTNHGATRFGFQASPQDSAGNLLGTMIITDTNTTKLVGNDKYVTYRANGVEGVDSRSWSWDWIAPARGTGDVTFYAAFNSNAGHKGGDNTYLSRLVLKEDLLAGLDRHAAAALQVSVYPNPAADLVHIRFGPAAAGEVSAGLYDLNGRKIRTLFSGKANGPVNESLSVSDLPAGNYLVLLHAGGRSVCQRLTIVH